jgi:hypothetical protein
MVFVLASALSGPVVFSTARGGHSARPYMSVRLGRWGLFVAAGLSVPSVRSGGRLVVPVDGDRMAIALGPSASLVLCGWIASVKISLGHVTMWWVAFVCWSGVSSMERVFGLGGHPDSSL